METVLCLLGLKCQEEKRQCNAKAHSAADEGQQIDRAKGVEAGPRKERKQSDQSNHERAHRSAPKGYSFGHFDSPLKRCSQPRTADGAAGFPYWHPGFAVSLHPTALLAADLLKRLIPT
jgi:hypothetical protein